LSDVLIGDLGVGVSHAWQLAGLRDAGLLTLLRILAGIATSGDSNDTPQPTQDGEAVDR
jgi:hypothetical protein